MNPTLSANAPTEILTLQISVTYMQIFIPLNIILPYIGNNQGTGLKPLYRQNTEMLSSQYSFWFS